MNLLYSQFLYDFYRNSSVLNQFFYGLLFIVSLVNLRHFKGSYIWFFWLFTTYLFFENSGIITKFFKLENDWFINHFYLFFSVVIQYFIYSKFLSSTKYKTFLNVITPLILLAIIVFAIYKDGYLRSPLVLPYRNFLFLFIYFQMHRELIHEAKLKKLISIPLFWFNMAFIIMSLYNFLVAISIDYIIPISDNLSFIVLGIKNLMDPICCVLWIIGVLKLKTLKPASSLSL